MELQSRNLWSNTPYLRALISYWDRHRTNFADLEKRNGAYEGAERAIWDEFGVKITKKQIQGKFEKLWNRHRAGDYMKNKNGYSEMFSIGPQCLDFEKLGLDPLLLSQNETIPEVNKMVEDLDLCKQPLKPKFIGTSDPNPQSLTDEVTKLQRELLSKDDEIRSLKESQYIHSQLSTGQLRARGPLDKDVQKVINHVVELIRQNASSFLQPNFTNFTEMQSHHRSLYELHQQVYGIDLEELLSIVYLRALGIPEVGYVDTLRSLIGMNVLQVALRSSFPEFFHDRGSVARIYEEVIETQFGKNAQKIFLQSAQYRYIKDPVFSDRIVPAEAKRLSRSLYDTLSPMLCTPNSGKASGVNQYSMAKDIWKLQDQMIQEIFEEALTLRAELWLNPDRYRFFWPMPNSVFDKREIRGDDEELFDCKPEDLRVLITLFPGIYAWDAESIKQDGAIVDDGKDGRRVVVKALCLLHAL